jgi:Na+-transporting methylmalonyl-CoA/oxaloacetate decarboxylase gamma subunit
MNLGGMRWVVAVLSPDPSIWEVIPFLLTGFLVVVATLSFLAVCCGLLARVCRPTSLRPVATSVEPAAPSTSTELSQETLAVIAAAIATVIDTEHRILHIRRLTTGDWNWSMEGRMKHHASHQIR